MQSEVPSKSLLNGPEPRTPRLSEGNPAVAQRDDLIVRVSRLRWAFPEEPRLPLPFWAWRPGGRLPASSCSSSQRWTRARTKALVGTPLRRLWRRRRAWTPSSRRTDTDFRKGPISAPTLHEPTYTRHRPLGTDAVLRFFRRSLHAHYQGKVSLPADQRLSHQRLSAP